LPYLRRKKLRTKCGEIGACQTALEICCIGRLVR
jgi:hypothetical protein